MDVWALGSIIYYMIYGDAPFKSMSEYLTFEKIKTCDYTFPEDDGPQAFDPEAKDLIEKIFVRQSLGTLSQCTYSECSPRSSIPRNG